MAEEVMSQQGSLSPQVQSLQPAPAPEFFVMSPKETFEVDGSSLLLDSALDAYRQEDVPRLVHADHESITRHLEAEVAARVIQHSKSQGGLLSSPARSQAAASLPSASSPQHYRLSKSSLGSQSSAAVARGSPTHSTSPRYSMRPRRPISLSQVPGPGAYECESRTPSPQKKIGSFGGSPARPASPLQRGDQWGLGVGPGAYAVGRDIGRSVPSYTILPRREPSPPKVPGPGAYESTSVCMAASARASFGSSPRSCSTGKCKISTISPNRPTDAPGPGSYGFKPAFGTGPATAIVPRREIPVSIVPGPGAYEHASPKTPRGSFPKSPARATSKPQLAAGPGSYSTPQLMGTGAAYTVQPRRGSPVPDVPGPGAYGHSSPTGLARAKSRQSFGKSPARSRSVSRDPDVGPGAYNLTMQKNSPKYSMTPRREAPTVDSPGPGAYLRTEGGTPSSGKRPSLGRFNLAARAKEMRESLLGPGAYDAVANSSGPSYSMTPKSDKHTSSTPGPGSYEVPRTLF